MSALVAHAVRRKEVAMRWRRRLRAVSVGCKRTEEGLIPKDWAVVALINISENQAAYVHASIPLGVQG